MHPNSPIGVFDSGLGGLTVLKHLEKDFPNETFIYFGDTAHLPYGNKSTENVLRYSEAIINFFLDNKTKAVIIACNTASALAYTKLNKKYNIPIFNVVHPSVEYANKISQTNEICILGTISTINSQAYTKSFLNIKSNCKIIEIASPLFVPLIEEGWADSSIAKEIASVYLKPLQKTKIDTLILGCTHYPIMAKTIQSVINNHIQLVFSGETIGKKLQKYLRNNNYLNNNKNREETQFYVTDLPQKFDEIGGSFLGRKIKHVNHITLI